MIVPNVILADLRTYIIDSGILSGITGNITVNVRKTNSILEDCVISMITGTTNKFINPNLLLIKIFYKDYQNGDSFYENFERGAELQNLLVAIKDLLLKNTDYVFSENSIQLYSEPTEKTQEHYVILRINFQVLIK